MLSGDMSRPTLVLVPPHYSATVGGHVGRLSGAAPVEVLAARAYTRELVFSPLALAYLQESLSL